MHGDDKGSVDRKHNQVGSPGVEGDSIRRALEQQAMHDLPFVLTSDSLTSVLESLREVCSHSHWILLAAHVRANHVHAVVESEMQPERIMTAFKSYSSRNLNRLGEANRKRWARHGSTKWLWNDDQVRRAIPYVMDEQGTPMASYVAEGL